MNGSVRDDGAEGKGVSSRPLPVPPPSSRTAISRARVSPVPVLVVWMAVAIAGVVGVAYWDERREASAVLDEVAADERWLAESIARAFGAHLASLRREARDLGAGLSHGSRSVDGLEVSATGVSSAPTVVDGGARLSLADASAGTLTTFVSFDRALAPLRAFERPNDTIVLVRAPGDAHTRTSQGSVAPYDPFGRGVTQGLRLSRSEAAGLGLPSRMAIAGTATVDAGQMGTWQIGVVATAQTEREREERARLRLLWSVTLAVLLIVTFGGAALRRRTRELELHHELELSSVANERDESLRRADKLTTLAALAMGVAHEVSTPLGVITARAEQILSKSEGDPRIRRASETILAESERINEVVRGLLSLVRGDEPRFEGRSASAIARGALELVRHRFVKAKVELVSVLDDSAPDVACDGRLLEQVLVNLLLNACDACTAGGSVELRISCRDETISFVVTDTGSGMAVEDRDRAVEPFFTTKQDGSGLGLAISNEIVRHHRGTLVIEAREDGPGTRAVVALPREGGSISPSERSSDTLRS